VLCGRNKHCGGDWKRGETRNIPRSRSFPLLNGDARAALHRGLDPAKAGGVVNHLHPPAPLDRALARAGGLERQHGAEPSHERYRHLVIAPKGMPFVARTQFASMSQGSSPSHSGASEKNFTPSITEPLPMASTKSIPSDVIWLRLSSAYRIGDSLRSPEFEVEGSLGLVVNHISFDGTTSVEHQNFAPGGNGT